MNGKFQVKQSTPHASVARQSAPWTTFRQIGLLFAIGLTCLALNTRLAFAHPRQDVSTTEASAPTAPDSLHSPQVYNWQDVPEGEKVPVKEVLFDAGGYQVICGSGDKIVVPFVNENTNVMKFGRSDTQDCYFVKDKATPVLYLNSTSALQNATVQDARWYPIPQDYAYSSPLYVGLAPTWNAYTTMGWYPGMTVYGGLVSNTRGTSSLWMPGYHTVINATEYPSYFTYLAYMTRHATFIRNRVYFTNYNTRAGQVWGSAGVTSSQGVAGTSLPLPSASVKRAVSGASLSGSSATRSASQPSSHSPASAHRGSGTRASSNPASSGGAGVTGGMNRSGSAGGAGGGNRSSGTNPVGPSVNVPPSNNRRPAAPAPPRNTSKGGRKH